MTVVRVVVGALLMAACTVGRTLPSSDMPLFVDLDQRGIGAPVYRIPALARTTRGTLLAVYDARPTMADVPSHIALVMRRSLDGGRSWSERVVVRADTAPYGFGDPSLLVDRTTGRVFLFHAASIRQGFFGSTAGRRDDDPELLHADVSWSDDDGLSWKHRRLTAAIKDSAWGGVFAASGEGLQLQTGAHAGRLLQQFVIRTPAGNHAASLISDDHGASWRMSALVGPGLDENKAVELSDGTVLLNSRARPYRLVARSRDGGATYSAAVPDSQLIDPANNGAILAMPRLGRKALLFVNTADTTARRRLTLRLSCDDGVRWLPPRVLVEGATAYATATMIDDTHLGVLFEPGAYEGIRFARIPLRWIGRCGS
jgi:sialidase-1